MVRVKVRVRVRIFAFLSFWVKELGFDVLYQWLSV